jgi:hypothetical protein
MPFLFPNEQVSIYLRTCRIYDVYSHPVVLQNTTLSFVLLLVSFYSFDSFILFYFSTMYLFFLSFFGSRSLYIIILPLLLFFILFFPSFFLFFYFPYNLLFIYLFILSIICLIYLTPFSSFLSWFL